MSAAVGVPESFVARKAAGQTVKKVRYASNLLQAKGYFLLLKITMKRHIRKRNTSN